MADGAAGSVFGAEDTLDLDTFDAASLVEAVLLVAALGAMLFTAPFADELFEVDDLAVTFALGILLI